MSDTFQGSAHLTVDFSHLYLLMVFQQMDSADVCLLYAAKGKEGSSQVEFWLRGPITLMGQEERFACLGCALKAVYERGFLVLLPVPHAHYFFHQMVTSLLEKEPQQQTEATQKSLPQLLVMLQRGLLQVQAAWEQISYLSPEIVQAIEQEYGVDRDFAAREPAVNEKQGEAKTLIDALCRVMDTIFMVANGNG